MVRLARLFLILLALIFGVVPTFAASSGETNAFAVAMDKFSHLSPDLSETNFADFVRKYPSSPRVPEAIWYEARAMLYSGKVNGAIDLLTTNRAGTLAPEYLYWLGRARYQNNDFTNAANTFAEVLQKYPGFPHALEATIWEATAFARLEQWPRLERLLTQTNDFQRSVRAGDMSETIASGFLLLGEAQLAQGKFADVESTLHSLETQTLDTQLKWRRDYLACRLQRAQGRLEEAVANSASLLATQDRTNRAEGVAFAAGVLEQRGELDAAANMYTNNLAPGVPPEQQRRAILKTVELDLQREKLPEAVQSLSQYLEQIPPPEAADLAMLTLGEVRLKQAVLGNTNLFQAALAQFEKLTNSFPDSPLIGKALLDSGWCLWNQQKIPESREAFRGAAERLPFSEEQAEARFKWADAQYIMRDFAAAVTNYNSIAEKYLSLPDVQEKDFIERALYQSARAAINHNDLVAAMSALKNILAWYPNGFAGPSVLLLTGQGLTEQKNPAGARKLFDEFEKLYPTNALLSEVGLAVARSYEVENNWDAAITNYNTWMKAFPTSHLQPQAQYNLARDEYMAGRETNALMLFTNYVAHFPTNALAARAQFWVGDFYLRQGDPQSAENNYQLVFKNTNWPVSDLTYEAQMAAGRAALGYFNYKNAIGYFTNLLVPDCPPELRVQATFGYADATIIQDSTNNADLTEAIRSLTTIVQNRSNSLEAAQALGRIGDCYFNMAAKDPNLYANAVTNYSRVVSAPAVESVVRNEARFQLANIMEKQAALKTGDEQTALLVRALSQYADAFYQSVRDSDGPSLFWTKKSGWAAAQLAESLGRWEDAKKLYRDLKDVLPVLGTMCDRKISKANEHLSLTTAPAPPAVVPTQNQLQTGAPAH